MNKLSIAIGILQIAASIEAATQRNWKLSALWALYGTASFIMAFIK